MFASCCSTHASHSASSSSSGPVTLSPALHSSKSPWWDKRSSKTSPNAPDFKHKLKKEQALWLDAWDNPRWVHQMLRGCDVVKQGSLIEEIWAAEGELKISTEQQGRSYIMRKMEAYNKPSTQALVQSNVSTLGNGYSTHEEHKDICANVELTGNISSNLKMYGNSRTFSIRDCWERLSLEEALSYLEDESGPPPSSQKIYFLLCKCAREKACAHASRLHAYMHRHGLEKNTSLGNQLVLMLLEVGNLSDAQQVFDGLLHRKECTWNFLIKGYIRCKKFQEALHLYYRMQEEDSLHPTPATFVSLLRACAELKDMEVAHRLHDHIAEIGLLEKDDVIGNALMNMYTKFKSLAKTREVFDALTFKNVVSWNTLMSGYAKHGRADDTLECFKEMQHEGISPNNVTFLCCLKACASLGNVDKGRELHVEIERKGLLETDFHLGSGLVDMYAKGGSLTTAQELLDMLPARNIVSWNALIAGYVTWEHFQEAMECFRRLQEEGLTPDAVTYICCLKACGSIKALDEGVKMHDQVVKDGWLEKDHILGGALVNMYAKCGFFSKAQEVFDILPVRDVIAWTSLIAGYAEHGFGEEALDCFEQMQVEGILPNAITYVCSIKACASIGGVQEAINIHADISRRGLLETDAILGSTLVDMYAKCGLLGKARDVFDELATRNVVLWNALITGYIQFGHGEDSLDCFDRMQLEAVLPDLVTYIGCVKACGSSGASDKGRQVHAQVAADELARGNLAAGNALIDMYSKLGCISEAQEVFDELPTPDVVSWNSLLAGYAQNECGEEALICLGDMLSDGFSPDVVTYVSCLKACGIVGAIEKGQEMHAEITKDERLQADSAIGNALVDMYAKCGALSKAREVFDNLASRDIVAWTELIAGYAQLGKSEVVFDLFDRMMTEGMEPNVITLILVLNACSHTGSVVEGQKYFEAISKDYSIFPIPEHYTCMVDLLCRTGQVEVAVAMVDKMPHLPDLIVWHTVLGACHKWKNVEIGRLIFEQTVMVEEMDTAAYVAMSNIFADAGMQGAAKKVKAIGMEKLVQTKNRDCWWTHRNEILHSLLDDDDL